MSGPTSDFSETSGRADAVAVRAMFESIYHELKRLARRRNAGAADTLNTTGLVHETYLKLAQAGSVVVRDRGHFFALAARAMRQIAIDVARARVAGKRGGAEAQLVEFDDAEDTPVPGLGVDELIRLDRALNELETHDKALADLVQLRVFAGLSVADVAEVRGVSPRTVDREWRRARTHLYASIHAGVPD